MALDGLTGYIQHTVAYVATKNGPSSSLNFPATGNTNTLSLKTTYTTGGDIVGGVNEVAANILTIAESGSATINLQSFTDVMNFTSVVLVRLKGYLFALLSESQDTVNGTNCSSVTIEGGASNPNTLNMGGTSPTFTLLNGDPQSYSTSNAAGITVSSGACNIKIVNNDSGNAAAVLYNFFGATT